MGEGGLIVRPPPVRPVPAAASLIAARHEIMACACGEMDSNKRPGREETCRNEMTIARKSYGDDVEMVCRKKGMEKQTEEARRLARADKFERSGWERVQIFRKNQKNQMSMFLEERSAE